MLAVYHVQVRRKNKLVLKRKADCAYYIPLLESLQQLLNNDSILEEVSSLLAFFNILALGILDFETKFRIWDSGFF